MRFVQILCLVTISCGICAAQDTTFSAGPQYLITNGANNFLRPINTPTLSIDAPLPSPERFPDVEQPSGPEAYVSNPGLEHQADLFPIYYGYARVNSIELNSTAGTVEVPTSITGVGSLAITDSQSLNELGYGVAVGEAAAYWKSHKMRAIRTYTNADIERLRQS